MSPCNCPTGLLEEGVVVTREDDLPESLTGVHSGAKKELGVGILGKAVFRLSSTSGILLAQLGDTAI